MRAALRRVARALKRPRETLRQLAAWARYWARPSGGSGAAVWNQAAREYDARLAAEQTIYKDMIDINVLPPIFHYWSNAYLRPMLEEYGCSNPDEFFANFLIDSATRSRADALRFVSLGAGNCDTEVRVAKLMRSRGLEAFIIDCLDINRPMLERGRAMAVAEGVQAHIATTEIDFNDWTPAHRYAGAMANQSLHHMLNLEGVFARVRDALLPRAYFVVSDMIGRNGHQRWPEALAAVRKFWRELPEPYRYNRQLLRQEHEFLDWDCSVGGFEGIRAQDILPLLLQTFSFELFIGFANVIDPFTDRGFGHNFDASSDWDRDLIDRIHAYDEAQLASGRLTPTHMMAVMTTEAAVAPRYSRGLDPARSVRVP